MKAVPNRRGQQDNEHHCHQRSDSRHSTTNTGLSKFDLALIVLADSISKFPGIPETTVGILIHTGGNVLTQYLVIDIAFPSRRDGSIGISNYKLIQENTKRIDVSLASEWLACKRLRRQIQVRFAFTRLRAE